MIDHRRFGLSGRLLGIAVVLNLAPLIAVAQEAKTVADEQLTVLPMEHIALPIGTRGQEMEIVVYLPHHYNPEHAYPVLVVPDADPLLGLLKTIDFLWASEGKAEPVILVGLPWGSTADAVWTNRSYYFLPRSVGIVDYYGEQLPVNNGGGAPELATFLEKQVLPVVLERYNVNRDRLGLVGFSMGGLFAAWHFVTHPGVFSDYIILSPPLAAPFVGPEFEHASQALRQRGFKRPTRLYVAYAENDLASVRSGAPPWIKAWETLDAPHLNLRWEVLEGHRHDSGAIPGLINGYEFLYGK